MPCDKIKIKLHVINALPHICHYYSFKHFIKLPEHNYYQKGNGEVKIRKLERT